VPTHVGVGVVVLDAGGRVLLAERRAERPLRLAVPGGRLEGGESVEGCAVRELREETGIELGAGAVTTYGCVLVDGWVVAGVLARVGAPPTPEEREPGKVGGFVWADPAAPPGELYPATAALLGLLRPDLA
jgi:8-oxo-dGTP diphosphatase